ncbi:MAG: EAL domain-containing protein [Pseudomonadales bacterium]|nr:EAL domain-containing protein [Pseudomonadales bacterium]
MIGLCRLTKSITLQLLVCLVLLAPGIAIADSFVSLSDTQTKISLTNTLRLFETQANIEPVENTDLQTIISSATLRDRLTINDSNTDYWFYGSFKTSENLTATHAALVLDHPYPLYDQVTLVINPLSENPMILDNGTQKAIKDRSMETRLMAFDFPVEPSQQYTFLLKVHSMAKQPFSMSVQTEKQYLTSSVRVEFIWGTFFGMFFIAGLYNLLIYMATQQRVYLYYVFFILSTGLAQAGVTGHGLAYLWPFAPEWNEGTNLFFIGFSASFGILFTQAFLNTKLCAPITHTLLTATHSLAFIIILFSQTLRYDIATTVTDLTIMWLLVLMMSAGIISYKSGEKTARFFLIGWGSLLTCMMIYIAMMRGYIPANSFTLFTPQLGSMLEITIITMAIADRIRQDRRDKLDAMVLQKTTIGKLQKAEQALLEQALHDPNTGLANQNMLDRGIQNVLSNKIDEETYLALIKIKDLRDINNTLGRYVGDEVAKFIAQHLKEILDRVPQQFKVELAGSGDNLAVIQGVTFAFIIKAPNNDSAINLVKNSLSQLPKQFTLDSISLDIETYGGTCSASQAGYNAEIWLRNAFVAIEQALQFSSYCQLYEETFNPYSERRLSLINDLKRAVESDALQVYLQPQLDSKTRSIVSAEALLRWFHPTHGFVPPDEFIKLAENSGVIKPLTRWVILHAVKALQTLHKQGYLISLSINVSPQNLEEPDLTTYIVETLASHNIDPTYLTFEMTETAMLANPDLASNVLNQWNKMGLATAIDDFGTGYSSLSHLKRLPMKELKIDRSFIKDMLTNEEDRHIVQATLTIGHSLGMRVVAEGVEDEPLLEQLTQMQCDIIQGYHLTAPLCLEDFIGWLQTTPYSIGHPKLHPIGNSPKIHPMNNA